jgi:hypothetical protein
MSKVFMLTPSQIAAITGESADSISTLIIRVSDQLKAGEISLIETGPNEVNAAKARLNAIRAKRRERHAKKKQAY